MYISLPCGPIVLACNQYSDLMYNYPYNHSYIQVYKARDVGVNSFVLFPKVPDALKVFDEYIELFVTTSNCASKMTCPVCSSRLLQEMRHTMIMVWFHGQFACSRISSLIL